MTARLVRWERATPAVLLVWWCAVLLPALSTDEVEDAISEAADSAASGSLRNQVLIVAFAAIGASYLPRVLGRLRRSVPTVSRRQLTTALLLLGLWVLWSLASVTWSIDVAVSLRRAVQLVLLVVGAVGVGLGWYGTVSDGAFRLARHAVVAGGVAMAFVWLPRLGQPILLLDPAWRPTGDGLGQYTAFPIAMGALAAVPALLARRPDRPPTARWPAWLYLGLCLLTIYAQKTRVLFVVTVVMLAISVYRHVSPRSRQLLGMGAAAAIIALLLMSDLLALEVQQTATRYATRGEAAAQTETLTGRVPLWNELFSYLGDRPLDGYGFGAFWNPDIIPRVQAVVRWPAVVAHQGFLDEALATGLTGLALFLAFWLHGTRRALRRWRASGSYGDRFVVHLMVFFLLVNVTASVMQTYYQLPFYGTVAALFALLGRADAESERWWRDRISPSLAALRSGE